MTRPRVLIVTVIALGLAVLAAGPTGAAPRGILAVGVPFEMGNMDPTMSAGVIPDNVMFSVFEPLLYLDPSNTLRPRLAESWQVVDPLTYVFKLRRNVKFHNGEPFDGKAVEFSWKRSQESHRRVKGSFATVARIEHVDDYTIRVITQKPDPLFLKRMSTVAAAIFPPRYAAEKGDEGVGLRPVGTGPFVFVEWIKGDHATFKANSAYYVPDVPKVETVIWRFIPESAARVAALQTGQVDIALRIPPNQAPVLERDPNIRVTSAVATRTFYVSFNNLTTGKGTPIENPKVRLALNLGVDVQTIIKSVFQGQAERVNSLIGNVQFGHDPSLPPLPYDFARAKALLTEAGYPSGFKTAMACPSGAFANGNEACQAIVGYLQKLGLEVDLQMMEPARYWDLEAKKQLPPLFFDGFGEAFQDPDPQLQGALGTDSKWTAFEKKEFTDLIQEAATTTDQEARRRIYFRLQRAMQADPPFLFLWQARNFEGARKRVQGYQARPTETTSQIPFEVSVSD